LRRRAVRGRAAVSSGRALPLPTLPQTFWDRRVHAGPRVEGTISFTSRRDVDPCLWKRRRRRESVLRELRLQFVRRRLARWTAGVDSDGVRSMTIQEFARSFTLLSMIVRRGTRSSTTCRNIAEPGARTRSRSQDEEGFQSGFCLIHIARLIVNADHSIVWSG
jgi:hypothetical protein